MKHPLYWSAGWPLLDRGGSPAMWPFYKQRCLIARRYPWLYKWMWFDFRAIS